MADHPEAMAQLRRLLAARRPLYAEAAHTVETSGAETDEVVRRIEALVSSGKGTRPSGSAARARRA
jgi:shikimate kinase